jgi:hypothetical protein
VETVESLAEVNVFLEEGLAFEVKFEGEKAAITEFKGISKVALIKEETKGVKIGKKKKGRKVPKNQKAFISRAAEILLNAKVPFKVTFGSKEFTLRFDLDHYLHVYPDKCTIVGFKNSDEHPIVLIKELFVDLPNVKLLTPTG